MHLLALKNNLRRPLKNVREKCLTIKRRIMEGGCEPTLDGYRIIDRIISSAAIITRTGYVGIVTMRDGVSNGAFVFEVSSITRSFGVTPRSGYRYILKAMPDKRVLIYETLARDSSRRSIKFDSDDIYTDSKIQIGAFSNKQSALDWCLTLYKIPPLDKCGIGHSLHIRSFW